MLKKSNLGYKLGHKLGLISLIVGSIITLRHFGVFQFWEWQGIDIMFQLCPPEPIDERIVIVGFNNDDMNRLGDSRLKDRQLAKLIQAIAQGNPRAIGLDIFRDHPVQPGHDELMKVFHSTPKLFGIGKQTGIRGDPDYDFIQPPPIAPEQIADASVALDGDDVQRRGFLYPVTKDKQIPSLGLALALRYLSEQNIVPKFNPNVLAQGNLFTLGQKTFKIFYNETGPYTQSSDKSYQILMNWRKAPFKVVSVLEVLSGKVSPQVFKGRIVLIGGYAPKLGDQFLTPFNRSIFSTPRKMYGVEAQAQLTSMVISAALDDRPLVKVWTEPWISLWIALWGGVGFVCASKRRWWLALLLSLGGTFTLLGLSYLCFLWAWWIPFIPPLLVLWLVTGTLLLSDSERERRQHLEELKELNHTLEQKVEQRTQLLQQQQVYKIASALAISIEQHLTQPLNRLLLLSESIQEQESTFLNHYVPFLESVKHPEIRESLSLNLASLNVTAINIAENLEQLRLGLALTLPNLVNYLPKSKSSISQFTVKSLKASLEKAFEIVRPILFNDYHIDIREVVQIDLSLEGQSTWIDQTRLTVVFGQILINILSQSSLERRSPKIAVMAEPDPHKLLIKLTAQGKFVRDDLTLFNCEQALTHCGGNISVQTDNEKILWAIALPTKL